MRYYTAQCSISQHTTAQLQHTAVQHSTLPPQSTLARALLPDPADPSIQFLRDILDFFGVKFKISPAPKDDDEPENPNVGTGEVTVSCVGVGYSNVNKAMA